MMWDLIESRTIQPETNSFFLVLFLAWWASIHVLHFLIAQLWSYARPQVMVIVKTMGYVSGCLTGMAIQNQSASKSISKFLAICVLKRFYFFRLFSWWNFSNLWQIQLGEQKFQIPWLQGSNYPRYSLSGPMLFGSSPLFDPLRRPSELCCGGHLT